MTAAFPGDHEAAIRVLGDGRPRRGVPARLLRLASDERLVEHIRAGSESAFEALFDRHHRGVLGFCRHMLGSVEEAEDAVQHTFLSAYRELVGSDKQVALRPWLYTIARNRCITMLRARRHLAAGELEEPPTEHLSASVERRHDLRDLLRDVAGLPEDQRAALLLSEIGDMSHDEIADVLGCRRDKVKALVFQARSSLIASRTARETPCAEIREQLASLRGGSLRRNELRRHVNECAGCREFRAQVRAQRRDLALVLPVAPTVGLKSAVIGGTAAGTAGVSAFGGGSAVVATKVLLACAIAGGGTVAVRAEVSRSDKPAKPEVTRTAPAPAGIGAPIELRAAPAITPPAAAPAPVGESKPATTGERAKPGKAAKPKKRLNPAANGSPPGHASNPAANGSPPGHASRPAVPPGQASNPAVNGSSPGQASNPAPGANPNRGANGPGAKPVNEKPFKADKPAQNLKPPKATTPGKAPAPPKPAAPLVTAESVAPGKPDKPKK